MLPPKHKSNQQETSNNTETQKSNQQETPNAETLQQARTPYKIHKDHNNTSYDPWPNGWGHKLQKDTTRVYRLFAKQIDSISLSRG